MAIEIVSFSMNSIVMFHSYVHVYQRVTVLTQQPFADWGLTSQNPRPTFAHCWPWRDQSLCRGHVGRDGRDA
jgi:hypothetical protein